MLLRDKIAGFLMAFGAIGLAATPLLSEQSGKRNSMSDMAVAITTGPQLNLLREADKPDFKKITTPSQRDVVCSRVLRLVVADVGLQCRELHAAQNLALAKQ